MIKALLLDIDDTLLDFHAYVRTAANEGFEEFGLGVYTDEMFAVFTEINNGLWHQLEKGEITFEELKQTRWNKVFAALGISFDGVMFEEHFRKKLFHSGIPINGAIEILEYLKGRYILCAASNGPYEQQLNRLKVAGMLPYFAHTFISEKIGASKPSKEFFDHCIAALNAEDTVLPEEIMIIGDSLSSDIAGGINSGLKTCYYDRTASGNTGGMKIDYIVTNLDGIREFL